MIEIALKIMGTIIPVILAGISGDMISEDIERLSWTLKNKKLRKQNPVEWKRVLKDNVEDLLIDIGLMTGSIISIIAIWI
ncbi:MAG: hypothetical protein DRO40_08595 [Thermoprotei archaeon]|nr:MAG: hypothetical protein DRO40_08595 [Thermoprotei archaeon]